MMPHASSFADGRESDLNAPACADAALGCSDLLDDDDDDGSGGADSWSLLELDPNSRAASAVGGGGRDPTLALDESDTRNGGDLDEDLDANEDDAGQVQVEDENDEDEDDDDDDDEDDADDDADDADLDGYEIENLDDPVPTRMRRVSFDEDEMAVSAIASGAGRIPARAARMGAAIGGVDLDEEDEVIDYDDTPGDILELSSVAADLDDAGIDIEPDDLLDDDGLPAALGKEDDDDEDDDEELFKEAASVLAGGSLFALGLDGSVRGDSSELTDFALGRNSDETNDIDGDRDDTRPIDLEAEISRKAPLTDIASTIDETDEDDLPPGLAPRALIRRAPPIADFNKLVEQGKTQLLPAEMDELDDFGEGSLEEEDAPGTGPKNLDAYVDHDEDDDEGSAFGVTSETAFGRVWELNDDMYVTITEPGFAYTYEIDEGDEEDQDSATRRRGADAGWGGTLKSDARSELPEGSREWIARQAYDLMTKSTYNEMYRWTRLHDTPPGNISALFPSEPPAPAKFARTPLNNAPPSPEGSMVMPDGVDDDLGVPELLLDDQNSNDAIDILEIDGKMGASDIGLDAIERSVNFPCIYKFKVVGSGDDFASSLARDVERVIGRSVPEEKFEFEPAGRYQRIIINVEVENARQVTALYDAIRVNPQVKFSYG
jgi:putative lipoic acid-binding regulatory protein